MGCKDDIDSAIYICRFLHIRIYVHYTSIQVYRCVSILFTVWVWWCYVCNLKWGGIVEWRCPFWRPAAVCCSALKCVAVDRRLHWMTTTHKLNTYLLHVLTTRLHWITWLSNSMFRSQLRVPSFQLRVTLLCGLHRNWMAFTGFKGNTQIIGTEWLWTHRPRME